MAERNNSLKIVTININGGLRKKLTENQNGFCDFINNYHVIMLQETHVGKKPACSPELKKMNCSSFGLHGDSEGYLTFSSSQTKGVAIIINTSHEWTSIFFNDGNYIGVCAKIGGHKYTFVSFYFHHQSTESLLHRCLEDIKWKHGIRVIGGDFNVTMDPDLDIWRKPEVDNHERRREMFNSPWPYIDVWREKKKRMMKGGEKDVREYTRLTYQDAKLVQQTRLDYFFMLEKDFDLVTECEILTDPLPTDHRAVSLSLDVPVVTSEDDDSEDDDGEDDDGEDDDSEDDDGEDDDLVQKTDNMKI